MWTLHTDSGNSLYGGQYAKNIYLGDTRIVTKLNSGKDPTYQEESQKQYYYHSDHLGSASLISDYNGKEYQRIEYTPYGETWVEKTSNTGNEFLPYKFTGKEIDEETGLYYYGARYLDPKYSLWISADPALGDYIPGVGKATANDIGNLPGMGGAFNHINFNLYHYAGNNPVKYTDPDGRTDFFSHYMDEYYDFMTEEDKSILYSVNLIDRAANGDKGAQRILTDAAKQVAQESCETISDTASIISDVTGDAAIAALAVGEAPVAATLGDISFVSGGISAGAALVSGNSEKIEERIKSFAISTIFKVIGDKFFSKFNKASQRYHDSTTGRFLTNKKGNTTGVVICITEEITNATVCKKDDE